MHVDKEKLHVGRYVPIEFCTCMYTKDYRIILYD